MSGGIIVLGIAFFTGIFNIKIIHIIIIFAAILGMLSIIEFVIYTELNELGLIEFKYSLEDFFNIEDEKRLRPMLVISIVYFAGALMGLVVADLWERWRKKPSAD